MGNDNMAEYCMKEYRHFLKGLTSLYDSSKGHYVSHYLDGDEYKPTRKNTVQVLFPLLVPDIPQQHKDSILAMLQSVSNRLFRKSTIGRTSPFPPFRVPILPTTLCLRSTWCGGDRPGQLQTTSSLRLCATATTLTFTRRSVGSGSTEFWRTASGRCGTHRLERAME